MPQVIGVGLRYLKTVWFDPCGLEPKEGDFVIVRTDRGEEMGVVREEVHEVPSSEVVDPLKETVRICTPDDLEYALELGEKEKEAFAPFREMIAKNELDMKPIDVEYLFGGDKIVFYFTSEQRVDFRQLVKDLANYFHSRIDMRQMGSRDQARMIGGLGRCGDELCCARFATDFEPVSIRMAKAQGLPPNPTKISGACGRLMCCLRYEVSAYEDFNKRAPKKGATIETPKGPATVVELDALRETVKLRFESDDESKPEILEVTLNAMSCKLGDKCQGHGADGSCCANVSVGTECPRPCEITAEAFKRFEKSQFDDDLLIPLPIIYKDGAKGAGSPSGDNGSAKPRKRSDRRRRSRSKGDEASSASAGQIGASKDQQAKGQGRKRRPRKERTSEQATSARQAAVSLGSGGTEANIREVKRIPRRRGQG